MMLKRGRADEEAMRWQSKAQRLRICSDRSSSRRAIDFIVEQAVGHIASDCNAERQFSVLHYWETFWSISPQSADVLQIE